MTAQRLIAKYGFRPIGTHAGLVRVAVDCWRAVNPLPPIATSLPGLSSSSKGKAKAKSNARPAVERGSSVSSSDVPLARVKRVKGKEKTTEVEAEDKEPLNKRFYDYIKEDAALYLRILRYEVSRVNLYIARSSLRVANRFR